MKNRKTRRSRCASETCGRQFRHADPSAATCSRGLPTTSLPYPSQGKTGERPQGDVRADGGGSSEAAGPSEAEQQAAERERQARHAKLKKSDDALNRNPNPHLSPTIEVEGGCSAECGCQRNQREP